MKRCNQPDIKEELIMDSIKKSKKDQTPPVSLLKSEIPMKCHSKSSSVKSHSGKSSDPKAADTELVKLLKKQSDTIDKQWELIDEQREQLKLMTDKIEQSGQSTNYNTNTVIQNNNNIIYVTDQLDYLEILDKKFGGEKKKTIEFIKSKLHGKLQGEVDMFSAIHLSGPPNTWPIRCPDKSKRQFYLVQPDNTMVPDPGGVTTHKNFYRNLQIAVLKLINLELNKVIDKDVGSEEFETLRDGLLDDFDLQAFQTRALEMSHQKPGPFVKRLVEEMGQREINNI